MEMTARQGYYGSFLIQMCIRDRDGLEAGGPGQAGKAQLPHGREESFVRSEDVRVPFKGEMCIRDRRRTTAGARRGRAPEKSGEGERTARLGHQYYQDPADHPALPFGPAGVRPAHPRRARPDRRACRRSARDWGDVYKRQPARSTAAPRRRTATGGCSSPPWSGRHAPCSPGRRRLRRSRYFPRICASCCWGRP